MKAQTHKKNVLNYGHGMLGWGLALHDLGFSPTYMYKCYKILERMGTLFLEY